MIGNIAGLKEYAENNGYSISDDASTFRVLRNANLYLLGLDWVGTKLDGQEDAFPRLISDELVYTPPLVEAGVYRMVCEIIDSGYELNITGMNSGPKVISESVSGAVSMTYSESSLYDESFRADWLGAYFNEWLNTPINSSKSCNFSVSRG